MAPTNRQRHRQKRHPVLVAPPSSAIGLAALSCFALSFSAAGASPRDSWPQPLVAFFPHFFSTQRITARRSTLGVAVAARGEPEEWKPLAAAIPLYLRSAGREVDDGDASNETPTPRQPASAQLASGTSASVEALVNKAAAAFTTSSSTLLGVKSIGVDYGLVRTGIASTIGYSPKPLAILSDLNATELATEIVKTCENEGADQIVLGLPLHKNGTVAEQTNLTLSFAKYLSAAAYARFGPEFPVYLWDERYTSKEAEARAHSSDPNRNLYKSIDADAACIILEHFYNDSGRGAEQAFVPEGLREACERSWILQREEDERRRVEAVKRRTAGLNAKRDAMERSLKLERDMAKAGLLGSGRKKKKKKGKKKKKRK